MSSGDERKLTIIDMKVLDKLISEYDWYAFICSVDNINAYSEFVKVFTSLYNFCKKDVIKQRRLDNKWMSTDILLAIREKNHCWTRCRRSPKNEDKRAEFK